MARPNPFFKQLRKSYIFTQIEERVARLGTPPRPLINLGVGDIALPLAPTLAHAIEEATEEMTKKRRGYGPSEGYLFLKEAIQKAEYPGFSPEEIFISDGTNTDASSIHEIFAPDCRVAVFDPSYPAYLDSAIMAGKEVVLLPCKEEEGFCPKPPQTPVDLVYLCTPCNPTGVALNRAQLTEWVEWARKVGAVLAIDNVYNCFVTSKDVPGSIYEIEGADEVAIEMRSFSKAAGFTGLRCAYMVIPKKLMLGGSSAHALWYRRVQAKTNGVAYPIQRGAAAFFTPEGQKETRAQIEIYKSAARVLRSDLGLEFFGGIDAPYIWLKIPDPFTAWEFFDFLLHECQLIAIPGEGFGQAGSGYMRFSCFNTVENAAEATKRIAHALRARL